MVQIEYGNEEIPCTDDLDGPVVIRKVLMILDGVSEVVDIRIIDEGPDGAPDAEPMPHFEAAIQYGFECVSCRTQNWLALGTDPSEYRCIKCTGWL